MISSTKAEIAFTETGYQNWKNAMETKRGFHKHELSDSHKEATQRLITIPATMKGPVDELHSTHHSLQKANNRRIFLKILANVRYLGEMALLLNSNFRFDQHCSYCNDVIHASSLAGRCIA